MNTTYELAQLRERIRELEAENARLKAEQREDSDWYDSGCTIDDDWYSSNC